MSTQTLRNSFGPWISVYPAFIKGTKSLEGGVLLSKLMNLWAQWGDGFYRTGTQLSDACCLSEREYKRAIQAVKESKAFTIKRKGIPAVNHFYVNVDAIEKILLQHSPASDSPDFVLSSSDTSVPTSSDDGVPTCSDNAVPTNKKEHKKEQEKELVRVPSSASQLDRFADFWKAYPRKVAKTTAQHAWTKLKLDTLADLIIADIKRRRLDDPAWSEVQYIPHPTTYLNQRRWEDEIQTSSVRNPKKRVNSCGYTNWI